MLLKLRSLYLGTRCKSSFTHSRSVGFTSLQLILLDILHFSEGLQTLILKWILVLNPVYFASLLSWLFKL